MSDEGDSIDGFTDDFALGGSSRSVGSRSVESPPQKNNVRVKVLQLSIICRVVFILYETHHEPYAVS